MYMKDTVRWRNA